MECRMNEMFMELLRIVIDLILEYVLLLYRHDNSLRNHSFS